MYALVMQSARRLLVVGSVLLLIACTTSSGPTGADTGKATPMDPLSRARIHTELAALYYQQGSMRTALDELANATRVDPDYAPAYSMLGLVYMQLGERDRANTSFQKAVALAPGDPEIRNNYGLFLCDTQQYPSGLTQLNMALANPLYATPAKALVTAARCARQMGDDALANSYRQRALQYGVTTGEAPQVPNRQTLQ